MGDLCCVCENLDLEHFAEPESSTPKFVLGSLDEIKLRARSCSFCSFIINFVERGQKSEPTSKRQQYQCSVLSAPRYFHYLGDCGYTGAYIDEVMDRTHPEGKDVPVSHERLIIINLPTGSLNVYRMYDESMALDSQLLRERRITPSRLNVALFNKWLQTCRRFHGSDCTHTSWLSPRAPIDLRLIDVRSSCVVKAPADCAYAALSYVWGGQQFVVNEAQMRNLPFRLPQPPVLGQTIADAISLCREMDIEYLWVDALCITQDPAVNDDKSFQLRQMDCIYRSACLTICAASSISAQQGIPELRARKNFQKTLSFKSRTYAVGESTIEDDIDFTPWNWRGWTYQERMLSRRLLVITQKQSYWICQCDTWRESTVSEPLNAFVRHQQITSEKKTQPPPGRRYSFGQNSTVGSSGQDPKDVRFAVYDSLIREYTMRSMGDPRDGINAVQGIMNLMKETDEWCETKSIHGLPIEHFDLAINWKAMKGTNGRSSTAGSNGLPSWSWASWFHDTGPGAYHDPVDFFDYGHIKGVITWFTLDIDGTSRLLCPKSTRDPVSVCGVSSEVDVLSPPQVPATAIKHSGFYLHFLSTVARFSIGKQVPWDEDIRPLPTSFPESIQPFVRHWATSQTAEILDSHGNCVGHVILSDSDYSCMLGQELEFVFLSYAGNFDGMAHASTLSSQRSADRRYSVVCCMLIWRDESTGFAKRCSVGKVLRDAWQMAHPTTEWMVLG